jgi:hypothetical protein
LSYRLFKSEFRFEKYLDVLNDKNRFTFCRFRTSNHRLPIEVGRWANVERHNRLCQSREIGDDFHYVLQCLNFASERKNIIFFQLAKRIKTRNLKLFVNYVRLRNKSWKPECVGSFNMDWRILVFYPEPEARDKIY